MKRLLFMLLFCMTMLFSIANADTLAETLGEIDIYNGGQSERFLSVNGRVQKFNYVYFTYRDSNGQVKEIPAYCVNPTDDGVAQVVGEGESVAYLADELASDPKVMGIIANGYPHYDLASLGLSNKYQGYYATKIALWCYLIPSWDISNVKVNSSLTGSELAEAQKVLQAVKDIYTRGMWWDKIYQESLTTSVDREYAYPVTIDGQQYKQQVITVRSETWVFGGKINVKFSVPDDVPEGTRIVDDNNNDITAAVIENTGDGYCGKFKILYPMESIEGQDGSVQLTFSADVTKYAVYYATCVEQDEYGKLQNYIADTDPTTSLRLSAISKFNSSNVQSEMPDTALVIKKHEEGTSIPVPDTAFEVLNPDGSVNGTYTTDENGMIIIPLNVSGNYTVTEIAPAKYYLPAEVQTQNVQVTYNNVATVVFENAPYGNLAVTKVDSQSGDGLPNALIQAKHIETGTIYTKETKTGGTAYFTNLIPGAYELKELIAPNGYILNTETYTINVPKATDTTYTIKNDCKPALRITKYDSNTQETMPDITFEIYHNAELFGTYTTDQLGEITLYNLEPGTYLVKEVKTDNAHILNSTPQQIEIKAGQKRIAELVFFNDLKPGIFLVKLDNLTMKGIPNIKFLIEKIGGNYSEEHITDENGEINLTNLETGAYTVKEILTTENYIADDNIRIIDIQANENAKFIFTNTRKPSLSLLKLNSKNNSSVPGATYRIAKIEDGTHYLDRVTDENGRIQIDNLEPGVYSVKEMKAPYGFVLDETEYHIELFPGKISQLVVKDDELPDLLIIKTDANNSNPVANVTYKINKVDSSTVTTVTTNANGEALVEDLQPGVYSVQEQSVPEGYILDTTPQLITLEPNRTGIVQFQNYKKSNLVIKKIDSITKSSLKEVPFSVQYIGEKLNGSVKNIGTFYTDENGLIELDLLEVGWYRIKEEKAPKGYKIDDEVKEIFIDADKSVTVTFENTPLSALIIKKTDVDSKKALPLAKFRVRYLSGISGTGGTVIGEYVTDSNGTIVITDLKEGTYICEEIEAPKGYQLDNTPQTVYISGEEQDVITIEFTNKFIEAGLKIVKLDEEKLTPIKNIGFNVKKINGEYVGDYITDKEGTFYIPNLEAGWYVVTETKAKGYKLDTTPHNIEVKEGEIATLTLTNKKLSAILLHKIDSDTEIGVYGVKFLLSDSKYNPIGQYMSDQDGYGYIEDLEPGKYYIREIGVPDNYLLDDTIKTVYVKYGETTEIEWENTSKKGQIQVIKSSEDTNVINGLPMNTLLENAYYEIYDKAGNTVDTIVTDKNGLAVSKPLPLGLYKIREVKAPDFYKVSDEILTAHIEYEGQIVRFKVTNKSIISGVEINKVGYKEVMPNQPIRYTFTNVANTSNVSLDSFYFRDKMPMEVGLQKIVTGTYNHTQNYKIMYMTNLSYDYQVLADNLSTAKNYILDTSPVALGFASGEYITEVMFVFGTVQPNFSVVEKPYFECITRNNLVSNTSFVNVADVGGLLNNEWIMAVSRWVTKVYSNYVYVLPKTGY